MTNKLDQKGFSVLELMIVISIIIIMTILAVPFYNNLTAHQRLNSAARTLLADIRGARELAAFIPIAFFVFNPPSNHGSRYVQE